MQRKPTQWDYILKTIKRDCVDILWMGLISLAVIPLLSIHKIHHVAQLQEIPWEGSNNVAYLWLSVRRERRPSSEESSSAGGENISLSSSVFLLH